MVHNLLKSLYVADSILRHSYGLSTAESSRSEFERLRGASLGRVEMPRKNESINGDTTYSRRIHWGVYRESNTTGAQTGDAKNIAGIYCARRRATLPGLLMPERPIALSEDFSVL